ncbi:hypothetical protein D3C85_1239470 [compost metagenome]
MAALEVPQLVRQHGFHFLAVQAGEQRVEEDDALGRTEAGEVGVAVRAALAAIHHEQALAGEAALAQQRLDALAQALVGQLEQQAEGHPQQPGPDPPVGAGALHQPQHGQQQRQAQHAGNQRHLGEVEQPQAEGHLVEAEALLDAELAI